MQIFSGFRVLQGSDKGFGVVGFAGFGVCLLLFRVEGFVVEYYKCIGSCWGQSF